LKRRVNATTFGALISFSLVVHAQLVSSCTNELQLKKLSVFHLQFLHTKLYVLINYTSYFFQQSTAQPLHVFAHTNLATQLNVSFDNKNKIVKF